jgi:hypothetical protein
LHSLSLLSGAERLLFTLQDPAAAWVAMPQLQQLRLQGVGLGYGTDSKLLPDRQVREGGPPGCVLVKLECSGCHIEQQQQQQPRLQEMRMVQGVDSSLRFLAQASFNFTPNLLLHQVFVVLLLCRWH